MGSPTIGGNATDVLAVVRGCGCRCRLLSLLRRLRLSTVVVARGVRSSLWLFARSMVSGVRSLFPVMGPSEATRLRRAPRRLCPLGSSDAQLVLSRLSSVVPQLTVRANAQRAVSAHGQQPSTVMTSSVKSNEAGCFWCAFLHHFRLVDIGCFLGSARTYNRVLEDGGRRGGRRCFGCCGDSRGGGEFVAAAVRGTSRSEHRNR